MKRIIISFLLLVISFLCIVNNQEKIKADTFIKEERFIELTARKISFINKDTFLLEMDNYIIIYTDSIKLKLEIKLNDFEVNGNNYYLLTPTSLYVINQNTFHYQQYELNMIGNDIVLLDNYLYIVGELENNACLHVYNRNMELLKEHVFTGNGYCSFKKMITIDNLIYVTGIKDAHIDSLYFSSVGNKGDMKSFIFGFDEMLNIKWKYFFNEETPNEVISSFISHKDSLSVILNTNNQSFLYTFTNQGVLINYQKYPKLKKIDLIAKDNNITSQDLIGITSINNQNVLYNLTTLEKVCDLPNNLMGFKLINGNLYLGVSGIGTKIMKLNEFHVDYLNDYWVSRLSYNINDTSNIGVSSYFENLIFEIDSINPYHKYMIDGSYQVNYITKGIDRDDFNVSATLEVLPYVNIIDGGIYKTNTKLFFFGNALLNGDIIENGYSLNKEGSYKLELTNVSGEKREYFFKVVNDYYKDNDHMVIPTDYQIEKNKTLQVSIELDKQVNIEYLFINGEKVTYFEQLGQTVIVYLPASSTYGYQEYRFNYLTYLDKGIEKKITLNNHLLVLTKKQIPQIDVNLLARDDKYQFDLNIIDPDNALVDIVFEEGGNTYSTYLNSNSIIIDKKTSTNIIGYAIYELGDGLIKKEVIFSYEGDIINNEDMIKVLFIKDQLGVKQATINLNLDRKVSKALIVNGKNVLNNQLITPTLIYYLTAGSSLIILLSFGVFLLIRKRKIKKISI